MKIELKDVKFKNFLSFGSKWQEVKLRHGVNLVLGYDEENDKSNGSGKCVAFNTLINIECSKEIRKILEGM